MIKIDSKVQKLRTTLSTIHQELPDRCIANDEQFYELYSKFKDVIEDTEYNIDIVDCLTALHCAMEDFEMYA